MKIKFTGLFLAAALILTVGILPVNAEFESTTAAWQYDFTSLTDDTAPSGMSYDGIGTDPGNHIYAEQGFGTKSINDTSAVMYSAAGTHTLSGIGMGQIFSKLTLAAPYVFHMSFDWQNGDYTCDKTLMMQINNNTLWSFMQIKTDGSVYINGSTIGKQAELSQWHKYDLYFYCGTTKISVYMDGSFVKDITYSETISYIQRYKFSHAAAANPAGRYFEAVQAVDNIHPTIMQDTNITLPTAVYSPRLYSFDRILSNKADYITQSGVSGVKSGVMSTISYSKFKTVDNTPTGGLVNFDAANGVFGKKPADKILHLSNPGGYFKMDNQYAQDTALLIRPQWNSVMPAFANNSAFRYSVSVAYDEFSDNSTKNIYANMNGRGVYNYLLSVSNGGATVKTFNQTLANVTFRKNTWYRLDYVFYTGDGANSNKVDVYLDGQKLFGQPMAFNVASNNTEAMTFIQIYNAFCPVKTGNKNADGSEEFKQDSLYLDDIVLDYKTNPADLWNGSVILTHTNADIAKNISGALVTDAKNITAEDFLSGAVVENGTVSVRDTNGTDLQSGALYGAKIAVKPEYGPEVFFKTERINKSSFILYNDFDDETPAYTPFAAAKIGGGYTWNSSAYTGGIGGKTADNKALIMNVAGHTDTVGGDIGNDPYLNYNFTTPLSVTEDIVYETEILGPAEGGSAHMCIALNGGAIFSAVILDTDGSIKAGGATVGVWESARWYKCVLVVKAGANTYDFYLNGKLLRNDIILNGLAAVGELPSGILHTVNRIKLAFVAPDMETGNTASGGFDSIKVYSGNYNSSADLAFITGSGVDDVDHRIFVSGYMTNAGFTNNYQITGAYKIFEDESLSSEAGEYIFDGCVLKIVSGNGEAINYYTFCDISQNPFVGRVIVSNNGAENGYLQDGTMTAQAVIGSSNKNIKMIIALYESGKMIDFKTADKNTTGLINASISVPAGKDISAKILFINDYQNITPLSQMTQMNRSSDYIE